MVAKTKKRSCVALSIGECTESCDYCPLGLGFSGLIPDDEEVEKLLEEIDTQFGDEDV